MVIPWHNQDNVTSHLSVRLVQKTLYLISFNCQIAVFIFAVICRNLEQALSNLTRCICCTRWGMFPQLEHQSLAKRRCLLSNFGTLLSARPLGKDTNKRFFCHHWRTSDHKSRNMRSKHAFFLLLSHITVT